MFSYPTTPGYIVRARDEFHVKLIFQEAQYWRNHPLTRADFDAICERRGFDKDEIASLEGLLKFWDVEWAG